MFGIFSKSFRSSVNQDGLAQRKNIKDMIAPTPMGREWLSVYEVVGGRSLAIARLEKTTDMHQHGH